MKAVILLATLKKEGISNTQTLCEFLQKHLKEQQIESSIIKLVEHNILAGTYSNMGAGDAWPQILEQLLAADIIIFATPIWWNNQSSEMQRVIERLDELHDEILAGKTSRLEGKVGGIVITGDSDGAQSIIANLSNFYNAIGLLLPPYATLSVLWKGQAKDKNTSRAELMQKYEQDYASAAETMAKQLVTFSKKRPA
ncbi:flavodoxin family protein [Adhaeribacter terreus]|uniref:Flavodoxin family protein n=1 Tax=Adhaeribacter terreus TaxID=529703 RepID=A0ABW0EAF3_9BACT